MPLLWLECNIKAGACVFVKKCFFPLPAAKCCFSTDFISTAVPAPSPSTNAFSVCSQEGVGFAVSEEELPTAQTSSARSQRGWWSYRRCSSPMETQWCYVLRASCIRGSVKSIIQLMVTITMVVLVFGNRRPNSVLLPRTQQFQVDTVFSSTSCSQLVLSSQEIHICDLYPRKAESMFHSKLHKTLFIMIGFLWDEPHYLARVRYHCRLSCSFPNPTISSCMPSCLFPM